MEINDFEILLIDVLLIDWLTCSKAGIQCANKKLIKNEYNQDQI